MNDGTFAVQVTNTVNVSGTVSVGAISLANSANSIGSVTNDGTFSVQVTNTANVALLGNATVQGDVGVTSLPPISLSPGSNAIGSVSVTGITTVANAPNFQVEVVSSVPVTFTGNVGVIGNVTVQGTVEVDSLPPISLANSANAIGSVSITGTPQVANAANFQVEVISSTPVAVSSLPAISLSNSANTIGSVTISGTQTVTGSVSLSAGSNAIGSIENTSFGATQSNAAALQATVANAANFQVYVENFPTSLGSNVVTLAAGSNTIGNVGLVGNATVQGDVSILGTVTVANAPSFQVFVENFPSAVATQNVAIIGNATVQGTVSLTPNSTVLVENFPATQNVALVGNATVQGDVGVLSLPPISLANSSNTIGTVNVSGTIVGGNPAAGPTGSAVPADASYTGYADGSGNLIGVSATNPFPTIDASVGSVTGAPPNYVTQIGYTSPFSGSLIGISDTDPLPVQLYDAGTSAPLVLSLANSANTIGNVGVEGTVSVSNAANFQVFVENFPASFGSNVVTLATGSNAIGSITNTSFGATQSNAAALQATVANAANFQVFVENFPTSLGSNVVTLAAGSNTIGNVGIVGNATIQGAVSIIGGATNPAAGPTGIAVPADGSYTAFKDVGGDLVGVSASSPFPITGTVGVSGNATVVGTGTFAVQVTSMPAVQLANGTNNIGTVTLSSNSVVSLSGGSLVLGAGSNAIGSITNTSFGATQSNAAALNATVAGTGTFLTQVQGFATTAAPTYANGTNQALSLDGSGNLRVTGTFTGGNAAAGTIGATPPTSGDYIAYSNGTALVGVSPTTQLPVSPYGLTSQTQVNPTITASSAYTAGYVVGGKLTFSNVVRGTSGVVQSVSIACKSVQTSGFKLYLFTTNPSNSTWADKTAPSINSADVPYLLDVINLSAYDSGLGTMTLYTSDNVGRAFNAASSNLYGVLVTTATPTFASSSDLFIDIVVLED